VNDHIIRPDEAGTLAGLFRTRVARTPDKTAYRWFDTGTQQWAQCTWADMGREVARWQAALEGERLEAGACVGLMMRNCREWVCFDQAALGLGLVVVPLYVDDGPENLAHILNDANVELLLIENALQWRKLFEVHERLQSLQRIVSLDDLTGEPHDPRLRQADDWLPREGGALRAFDSDPDALATVVYTSGTTGRAKGVMLTHRNILWNAHASLSCVPALPEDIFLSFLPLCHTFERTVGYYLSMMAGSETAYARSVQQLSEDLATVRPTVLVSVPRIYERVYNRIHGQLAEKSPLARRLFLSAVEVGWRRFEHTQGRVPWHPSLLLWPLLNAIVAKKVMAKLGGRLRIAISGGAALSPAQARLFLGLGLTLIQGYGLTETSPVISANRIENNQPASVGLPLDLVETHIGAEGELQVRSPGVMRGYWNNPTATQAMIDSAGWLHTGDQARIEEGRIFITGRLKEIIVLSNGKKVAPAELEMHILLDPLFEQVMIVGEGHPFLGALVVPSHELWPAFCAGQGVSPDARHETRLREALLARIEHRLTGLAGYEQVRRILIAPEPWSVDNGLLTPTLKLRRKLIETRFNTEITEFYTGH
jgi:long-chain acyl-CoA synthetase